MGKITVEELDQHGVVVDLDRAGSVSGQLSKAGNAVADPLGEKGSIRKRPGLKQVNSTVGAGVVRGGIGVPRFLGGAGPNIGNPFTDITNTITQYVAPVFPGVQRLGATFDDESQWLDWDFNFDFYDEGFDLFGGYDLYDIDGLGKNLRLNEGGDPNALNSEGLLPTILPVTFVGKDGLLYLSLQLDMSDAIDNTTTYPDTRTLLFPTGGIRGQNSAAGAPLLSWYTSAISSNLFGKTSAVLGDTLYYANSNYTTGTDDPPLNAYDGYSARTVARAPKNLDVSATVPANAIVSLLAANGKIYFTTFDGGTNGSGGGTVKGSCYEFSPSTNGLVKLGATFPTGHMPYSLTWAYGRVWVGTAINSTGDTTAGRVYWFRPDIDTSWTLDKTFSSNEHIVTALATFQGQIYASIHTGTGSGGLVYVRSTAGTWTSSEATDNAYFDLLVWPTEDGAVTSPASALYTVGLTGATRTIRKFAGSTWSAVTATGVGYYLASSYVVSSGSVVPALFNTYGTSSHTYNTVDGTTWADRTVTSVNHIVTGLLIQL